MGLLLQGYDNIIWEMLQTLCVLQSSANTSPVIGGMCHYKKKTKKKPKKICSLKTDSKISGCKIRKMTKKWLWNFVTFYVDDHIWISRKLMYRCFMLSLSFQGGLFNLLGFAVEQNSATNSLRGTVRKKEEKWGRKVILACIPKNLHMNVHVCTSLCAKKKYVFHFIKWKSSVCQGKISEKKNIYLYILASIWFHWNSGKSKATEILIFSVFTG